jgi:hypothetical protein
MKINNIIYNYSYKFETHAAYHHDIIIKEANLEHIYPLNNINEPINFIRKVHHIKNNDLPPGIQQNHNRYTFRTNINNTITRHSFDTLNKAITAKKEYEEKKEIDKINNILSQPIKRDKDGIAVLELHNKQKEVIAHVQVDDHKYYHLILFAWYLNKKAGVTNSEKGLLSRYLMNYTGPLKVDHIDHNTLNARISNLRLCTQAQNTQNKSSKKGSTSEYVGVHKEKTGVWRACAAVNEKYIIRGTFKTELEAVKARDKAVYLHNQEHGTMFHINLPK